MAYVIREYRDGQILPVIISSGQTREQIKRALAELGITECPKLPRYGRAVYITQAKPRPTYVISVV